MKNKKRFAIISIIAIVLVIVIAAIALPALGKKNKPPLSAPLAAVGRGPLEDRVSAAGSFQAEAYTVVSSQTVGIVKGVYVKPGDHVEKNDLIVIVDERDARESLSSAEIALEETRRSLAVEIATLRSEINKASLAYDQAKRAAEGAERLRAVDGISEEEFLKADEQRDTARMALSDARDRLRVAQGLSADQQPSLDPARDPAFIESSPSYRRAWLAAEGARRVLEGCVIRAERSGVVTEIGVSVGHRLTIETVVARIEDLSSVIADVNVDEVDIDKVREGMPAEITADSLLGKTLEGKVSRVWPIVKSDGNGRICRVRIAFNPSGLNILSGASCMARITSRLRDDTLTIPASALIPGAKPSAVWVAVEEAAAEGTGVESSAAERDDAQNTAEEVLTDAATNPGAVSTDESVAAAGDGKAGPAAKRYKIERREIEIGKSTVSTLEVLSGLEPGEQIVVDQLAFLTDGMTIQNGSL